MAGKEFAVKGAVCMCKYGAAPAKLETPENQFFKLNGSKLTATTKTLGSVFGPAGFGVCKINPMFPRKCAPAITQWSGFYNGIKTSYGGFPLTDKSKATCSCGAPDCIEFTMPGQIPIPGVKDMQKATKEHLGELDCAASTMALSERPFNCSTGINTDVIDKRLILIQSISGPANAFAGENNTYKVERFNTPHVDPSINKQIKWTIEVDGKNEPQSFQGHTLQLTIKNEWAGKEIIVMAYLNTPSKKVSQKTKIGFEYECVVVIGTQQHSSSKIRNLLRADVAENSKFMFVHQALREVQLNRTLPWTVLLCSEGYSEEQINKTKEAFNNIAEKDKESTVKQFIQIASPSQIINYLNYGNIHGVEKYVRSGKKVSRLSFYSHGIVKDILLWMGSWGKGESFDVSLVSQLKQDSFADDMITYSYACRTGLGNPQIDNTIYKNKKTRERYDLLLNESLAQKIANSTNKPMRAYLKRTWYGDTLLTSDEYDFLDACMAFKLKKKSERNSSKYIHITKNGLSATEADRYKKLRAATTSFELIDGATFYSKGAMNPVKAATTPEGLSSDMSLFFKEQK